MRDASVLAYSPFPKQESLQQQPDSVLVLTQSQGVESIDGRAGAALQAQLGTKSSLQEVVLPDVSGEEWDGERHHRPALEQCLCLLL